MLGHQLETPIRATWVVNDSNTDTLWWPKRPTNNETNKPGLVFMFICGNPGVIDYYTQFLSTVHELMHYQIDIVGVSHPGHTTVTGDVDEHQRSLSYQIEHKIACLDRLRETYPTNTQFVLAGHSVGSYIALQVLNARPSHGIARVICLFPTIQEIRNTPNGHNLQSYHPYDYSFLFILDSLLASTPAMVSNSLSMARDEMEIIKALQTEMIREHLDKLLFYYGVDDNWSPITHYKEMASLFPEGE
ncbi:hypothetical protein BDF22DRAFT_658004 [Syncephalis plumigaleata]|nr:hypothetical protein BDF22DRAFT_658004 [Syncephalis plumigaleata]